jgi:hypothetical protein
MGPGCGEGIDGPDGTEHPIDVGRFKGQQSDSMGQPNNRIRRWRP